MVVKNFGLFVILFFAIFNFLIFVLYIINYYALSDTFCKLFYFDEWEYYLKIFWPSTLDIMKGIETDIGQTSACIYYIFTFITLVMNVVLLIFIVPFTISNAKHMEHNIKQKFKDVAINAAIYILFSIFFIYSTFYLDSYNYGNIDKKYHYEFLDPNSAWDGLWNILRLVISFYFISVFSVFSIFYIVLFFRKIKARDT